MRSRPDTHAKTQQPPADLLGGYPKTQAVVTHLLQSGREELRKVLPSATVGSRPDRDIVVQNYASARHCRLEQIFPGPGRSIQLEVIDEGSTNGTFYREVREDRFVVEPGHSFVVGATTNRFVALNDSMVANYQGLLDIVGRHHESLVQRPTPMAGDMLIAASLDKHILITGEVYCAQRAIASLLHEISPRRSFPMVYGLSLPSQSIKRDEILEQLKRQAVHTTLLLDLDNDGRAFERILASSLFVESSNTRLVVLCRDRSIADRAFGKSAVLHMEHFSLPPISERPRMIPRLLDREFTALASPITYSRLSSHDRDALLHYKWPYNLESIKDAAKRLTAIAHHQSINLAATTLGLAPATLYKWHSDEIGLMPRWYEAFGPRWPAR